MPKHEIGTNWKMKYDPLIHHRRSIRLPGFDYSQPGAYFITLVTKSKISLFGEIIGCKMKQNVLGKIIRSTWLRLPRFFPIRHDEWVIMPNHLHGIIWILDKGKGEASAVGEPKDRGLVKADASPIQQPTGTKHESLGAIIQNFKSVSTRKVNQWLQNAHEGELFDMIHPKMTKPLLTRGSPLQVWQRNYFEHIIHSEKELDRIRKYIIDNPRKWAEDKEYHA